MPRAYPQSETAGLSRDPAAGEWQALRGELVALLDKVESRYAPAEAEVPEPAVSALSRRMQHLRDQVEAPEPTLRRREALRTVKRAVDRFSERDDDEAPAVDDLTSAIAEIRSRQGAPGQPAPMPMRRGSDGGEIRELNGLVTGMTQRLERLEGELKSQRSNAGSVREVASQVEQLTQVVELLAGAIGETGQVKRLEGQIAALSVMIEQAPKTDLSAINQRLDDVSATVGKLAELQAQQMEREIGREQRATPEIAKMAPAMESIEASVRSVYDRIDAIERNVAMSSADFERLTGEMAAFTQAMKDNTAAPKALIGLVETMADRIEAIEGNAEVQALKGEIAGLRAAVLQGIEPRFVRLENQIEALSDRIVPVDTSVVENQLTALMARMDDAGAQLDGLARLYNSGDDRPDFESLATMVAERTSEAVARKATAPVAMFGADSLKSIEDRITGLIKSAGKTPDYESLADLVAARTSEAVARSVPATPDTNGNIDALEKRMTSLLNTAGKDTAERLTRLEAMLAERNEAPAPVPVRAKAPAPELKDDPFEAVTQPRQGGTEKLDSILQTLSKGPSDAMPVNPADEHPLVDRGPKPMAQAPSRAPAPRAPAASPAKEVAVPVIDPESVQRPPRPQSSFAEPDNNPFSEPPRAPAPTPEAAAGPTSTSTFVAAARRAQRAKQEDVKPAPGSTSLIGRALARVRQNKIDKVEKTEEVSLDAMPVAPVAKPAEKPKKEKPVRAKREPKAAAAPVADMRMPMPQVAQESFLTKHRRPLLLAATLVAVSLLALNLVLQRMDTVDPVPAPEAAAAPEEAPVGDVSTIAPPRVIDMVDPTATGSINPGAPMTFSKPASAKITAPITPALLPDETPVAIAPASLGAAPALPDLTPVDPPADVAAVAEPFDLPAEGVGPLELREAAAKGNAKAQFEVAAIYGEGRAVEKDLEESAKWYERSAAQGFVPAQYRLGNLYELGSGVEKDLEEAKLWYQRSAEAGNRMAMHNLAALHAGGQMGEQEFEVASEWFARAAALGMTDSQFNLGMLYARGLGVEQDFEQSYKWFSLAALSGDKDATQARDDIAKSLTAEAVSRINDEVKAWKIEPVDFAANFAPIGTWTDSFAPGDAIGSREVVSKVQQALNKLGFDLGTPDGVAGPKTRDAISAFERSTGMSESGAVNPRLLAVLGSQPV
ncbi:peptidoglycan-binding protein [Devosia rhizoryzae]|uniref:SEL1-like repeat protein n=1 Tax=Devosia rhizoryzae TaxID=2774137 RepID=A0ABX7C2Z4_9HYPH|nr:peptidoglycan-binding protein [Devosia rhizoryzae]QQR38596.1 SEL1-like repeat protein [Devosia rhizoryzae]